MIDIYFYIISNVNLWSIKFYLGFIYFLAPPLYQIKFEKLENQVVGLPSDSILHCSIPGLNLEIQNEMDIHKPTTISQAIDLAKLIESKLKDVKP